MTTAPLPLTATWILNAYVNDVNSIRFDDERIRAIDAEISQHNEAILKLRSERGVLRDDQEARIAVLNDKVCADLHVKRENDYPVRRQGPPKKERVAEPTLLPPGGTTEPAIVAGVAEASAVLSASAGEAPTGAETFVAAVSAQEAALTGLGYTAEDIVGMPPVERERIIGIAQEKGDSKLMNGRWVDEKALPGNDPIENEDAPS